LGLFALRAEPQAELTFQDKALEWGITALNTFGGEARKDYILETTGNGAAIFDWDNDGDQDILILNGTRLGKIATEPLSTPSLYRNDGGGKFTDISVQAGLTQEGWAQGVCAGDIDNDGFTDVYVTFFGTDRLYRNVGGKRFEDVTAKAKLRTSGTRFGSGCTFLDFNRDGRLDLFVSNYVDLDLAKTPKPGSSAECKWKELSVMCGPRGLPKASNLLYEQAADGSFRDVSAAMGILKPGGRYSLQAVAADFDADGWPDIYVACDMTPSLLFHNKGGKGFAEIGVEAGVAYNYDGRLQAGMGVAVADYDRDGLLDIAKTNFSGDLMSLFHNEGGLFFTDVSREAGLGSHQLLGWGVAFTDFDDDGWPDLMSVNGHVYPEVEGAKVGDTYRQATLLFHNERGKRFRDYSKDPVLQTPRPTRGLAFGDLDGDGRPEAVLVNMNDRPAVLQAASAKRGNFVNLLLEGSKSNRSAIGARYEVEAGQEKWTGEVMSGSSFYSQHSFVQHVGLGAVTRVNVTVKWPGGKVQRFVNLDAGKLHRLRENP
jgi:enediyne biosynthesis protein E4